MNDCGSILAESGFSTTGSDKSAVMTVVSGPGELSATGSNMSTVTTDSDVASGTARFSATGSDMSTVTTDSDVASGTARFSATGSDKSTVMRVVSGPGESIASVKSLRFAFSTDDR
jgi:hypothetical protein